MSDAFYLDEGDGRFLSSEHTIGPWGSDSQHGGPPAALLGRAIERVSGRDDMQMARVSFEILKPIPIELLTVQAHVVRPGRRVELVEASLSSGTQEVMRARAWRIRTTKLELEPTPAAAPLPPGPEEGHDVEPFQATSDFGYLGAMEWRFVSGSFLQPGPATAWLRMRYPLVGGEEITPLTRVLIAADSGSGISGAIDYGRWFFINPDLTVYLHRLPAGEWVCLDAATTVEASGVGLASSLISDETGPIGRGIQSLFIGPR